MFIFFSSQARANGVQCPNGLFNVRVRMPYGQHKTESRALRNRLNAEAEQCLMSSGNAGHGDCLNRETGSVRMPAPPGQRSPKAVDEARQPEP